MKRIEVLSKGKKPAENTAVCCAGGMGPFLDGM